MLGNGEEFNLLKARILRLFLKQAIEDFVVESVVEDRTSIDAITAWLEPRIHKA